MSRTLVGICAYGGLKFLELGLAALRKQKGFDVLVIVAKPGDEEMWEGLQKYKVSAIGHTENTGFAAAINDMFDFAFVRNPGEGGYDNLIIMGNDVIPMPHAVEKMIECADTTDYEMVCGSEFDVRFLVNQYPEARQHFEGSNLVVKDSAIQQRVWEMHQDFRSGVQPHSRKDIRNFTLFKRSAFEKVGYADVNFWPNAYFEDNDYCRRCDLLGVSACGLLDAPFFHWWSRTNAESAPDRPHNVYFDRNASYYRDKWHGFPGEEKLDTPFGGGEYFLHKDRTSPRIRVPNDMKIDSREHEQAVIEYWSTL
jgi:GT2 family glycosyltransferase